MDERRKDKRTELVSKIVIKRLDTDEGQELNVDLVDLSKSGVGFLCAEILTIGAVYESYLTIWTKEVIHAFIQIARIELKDDIFMYGASFVGMPEMDSNRIGVYQTVNDAE